MIINKIKYMSIACVATLALGATVTSCVDDLNVEPKNPSNLTDLTNGDQYYQFLAQVYGGLTLSGVNGGSDITVDDPGAGVYTRQLWNLQELPTDEAFIGKNWNDAGLDELDYSTWSADNHWLYEAMSRFTFQVNICNEFLRKIDGAASVDDPVPAEEIARMKCEARTLRALSYYHIMDCFGVGPYATEDHVIGTVPATMKREEMFPLVVEDLKEAVQGLPLAKDQVYGRVSREAGYMLLAKLYLNAEVYTGTPMWTECAQACQEVLKTNNTLAPEYKYLFCGSNDKYVGTGEILWGVPQDNSYTQSYGGTTYLGMGAYNESIDQALQKRLGISGTGWSGPRVRPELANVISRTDKRYLFYTEGLSNDLSNIGSWEFPGGSGYMCVKYVYTNESDYYNESGAVSLNTFNNADWPLFRLADTYLMLAECQLHGVACDGKTYFDKVRARAGLDPIDLTADNLLDERARELYWEGHRRSDLIRFGKFTGSSYVWSWKGGIESGQGTESYRNVFAVPTQYINTLGQNTGY